MEPRFEVQTVYSKEYIDKLCHFFAKRPKYRFNRLLYLICAFLYVFALRKLYNPVVVKGLLSGALPTLFTKEPVAVLIVFASLSFSLYLIYRAIFMVQLDANRLWKKRKQYEGSITSTSFFDDHFCDVSNKSIATSLSYNEVTAVEESDDFFCIITSNAHGITVAKSDFTISTPDDFRAFIEEKTGKKIKFIR